MAPDEPDDPTQPDPAAAQAASRRSSPKSVGERYAVGERIGAGGMGEVLSARDAQVGRVVAIKRMRGTDGETARRRFVREAQIQGRLEHPAIVPVHEIGNDPDGTPYFVMKKIAGTTLENALHQPSKFPRERLLRAYAEVCLAVELAHTRGVVHRDLKPSNIMLGDFGEVYVLDWGVAKLVGESDPQLPAIDSGELTRSGAQVGTPAYMAPEQARGAHDLDGRADVYSLGCVLFEILVGVQYAHVTVPARALDDSVPPELDALCTRATAPDRGTRLASARDLAAGVERYVDGDRDHARRHALAEEHLQVARRAFDERHDHDQRAIAMREAGRALALDPTLAGAGALVGRLMLEPPDSVPADVEAMLVAENRENRRQQAVVGAWVYVGYLGFLPFMLDLRGLAPITLVFVVVVAANLALVFLRGRGSVLADRLVALRQAIPIAIVSLVFSPFAFAPLVAVAITSTLTFVTLATPRSAIATVVAMSLGVLGPWLAALWHLVPESFQLTPDGFVVTEGPMWEPAAVRYLGLVALVIGTISICALVGYRMRRTELASRRALHLQAWQLRQLVP